MKQILIASFDMEVGGVERSLVSMLNNFAYDHYQTDLMLYSHTGDFMNLLHHQTNLLEEIVHYKTFRMTIREIIQSRRFLIALTRILAKYKVSLAKSSEKGYQQMQWMWKYALPFLPKIDKNYDVAISYLWPHYFVAEKVQAKSKIAWIHTDFSTVETNIKMDLQMWEHFNYIVAVSEECKNAFIMKYPTLKQKMIVIENITSPDVVQTLAQEEAAQRMKHDQRFKLITVARLSHAKGIDRAVQALKVLKDRGYDFVWYVVGYGGDEEMIRTLVAENGLEEDFILLGKKVNPYPYIKAADLYVQPSRYEGKAVTVSEAQILSQPVLITNYPTAQSQITDGVDGLICDQSIKGIADGIERLYNDPKLRDKFTHHCKLTNYENSQDELNKLYELM